MTLSKRDSLYNTLATSNEVLVKQLISSSEKELEVRMNLATAVVSLGGRPSELTSKPVLKTLQICEDVCWIL
jgi:hypothetical protein